MNTEQKKAELSPSMPTDTETRSIPSRKEGPLIITKVPLCLRGALKLYVPNNIV